MEFLGERVYTFLIYVTKLSLRRTVSIYTLTWGVLACLFL